MFCGSCGYKLNDDGKFCPRCGTPVSISLNAPEDFENVKARNSDNVVMLPEKSMVNEMPNGQKKGKQHKTRKVKRLLLQIFIVVCICGISSWMIFHVSSIEDIEEIDTDVSSITGIVTDSDNGNQVSGVTIMFVNEDGNIEDETLSGENGEFSVSLTVPQTYVVILKADGYKTWDALLLLHEESAGKTEQFNVILTVESGDEIEVDKPDPTEWGSTNEFWGNDNVMGSLSFISFPASSSSKSETNTASEIIHTYVKNSKLEADSVVTITFLNSLEYMPTDAWDISKNEDGTVMAWISEAGQTINGDVLYHLYIAGEGGVKASTCFQLFCDFDSVVYIDFNGCFDTANVTDMSEMFRNCGNLISLNMEGINTSNVTDMSGMFADCSKLLSLDLSDFDTSTVTNMSEMFKNDRYLRKLDLSSFDTSNVTDMSYLFFNTSVRIMDLNDWNVSNVVNMERMFAYCWNLVNLNVADWNVSNVENMTQMFYSCKKLDTLDVKTWGMTDADTTDMFMGTQWE